MSIDSGDWFNEIFIDTGINTFNEISINTGG